MKLQSVRWVAVITLASAPITASADNKADAKKHVERAMQLHGENKFQGALDELTAAYSLDPQPDLLYAIGQVNVKLEHCDDAIESYQRFLDTKPKPGPAGAAREAIAACKKKVASVPKPTEPKPTEAKPAETKPTETKPTETKPTETKPTETKPTETKPTETTTSAAASSDSVIVATPFGHEPGPWYKDVIGDALVAGGIAGAVVGVVLYRSASSKLDDSEHAPTYQASVDLVDSAHATRTYALIASAGGAVLIGAGLVHYVMHGKASEGSGVSIAPVSGGGLVTFSGGF